MLKQVLTLSGGSALGKVLGVAREVILAALFGTTAAADAYRAALTATLAPAHLFTQEALNAAFIPQFRKDRKDSPGTAWSLFNGLGLLLLLLSLVIGGVLYFFASSWISFFLPGFSGERHELAIRMLRIMAWGVPLYILSALLISLEIASGHFRLAALRPLVQNMGIIVAITAAFLAENPVWIALGFTGTYFFFSFYEIARLVGKGILVGNWHRYWGHIRPAASRFWEAMKPMVLFALLLQANIVLEKAVASLIGPGAVASVDYARLIPETAQVLLIMPIGMVSLSAMVTMSEEEVRQRSDRISAMTLVLLVPLSGLVLVSAPDVVKVLYARGAFDEQSVVLSSLALRGMSVGMWAVCLTYVFHKIYNSRLRNREVLRIGAAGILVNAVFNLAAYRFMGVLALGLGYSMGGIVMAALYMRGLGGARSTWKVARLCLYGMFPYLGVGLIIGRFPLAPLLALAAQVVWAALLWGVVFLSNSDTRDMLGGLAGRLIKRGANER